MVTLVSTPPVLTEGDLAANVLLVSSSVKKSRPLGGRLNIRTRNDAISARVTSPLGQNLVGVQPPVMPAS